MEAGSDADADGEELSLWQLLHVDLPVDLRIFRGICAAMTAVYAFMSVLHADMGVHLWPILFLAAYTFVGVLAPAEPLKRGIYWYLSGLGLLIPWTTAYTNSLAVSGDTGVGYTAVTLFIGVMILSGRHLWFMAPVVGLGVWAIAGPSYDGEVRNALTIWASVWAFSAMLNLGQSIQRAKLVLTQRSLAAARDRAQAATRRAEEADRAKSEVLAQVSHELRTPLNGVLGMAEVLRQRTDDERSLQLLGTLRNSARALRTLLNDILDASKIDAGRVELEAMGFAPDELVNSVVDLFQGDCEQRGLSLRGHVADGLPVAVVGDPARLQQVLCNLVSNAIKFTRQGSIDVRLESRALSDGRAHLRWSVQDSGIGIDPQRQEVIFEAFTQADTSINRRFGGTGLGLHISSQLIALMGGRMELESQVGEGSTFTVSLDLDVAAGPADADGPHAGPSSAGRAGRLRILVADDAEVNLLVAEATLEALGHEPVVVDSAAEALRRLDVESFDLFLVDLEMPEMDGCQAVRNLRAHAHARLRELPVIALSGQAANDGGQRSRDAGMNGYLAKPYAPEELADAIRTVMEERAS